MSLGESLTQNVPESRTIQIGDDDDYTDEDKVISALDGLGVVLAVAFVIAGIGVLLYCLLRPRFPLFYKHNCLLDESEGEWVKQIPGRKRVLKQYQNKLGRKTERRLRKLKEKGIVSEDAPTRDIEAQNDDEITVVEDRNHNLHYMIRQGEDRVKEEIKTAGIIDFHWVIEVLKYKEELFLETQGGIDVVIYLRWLKYSIVLLSLITLFSVGLLLPMFFITPDTLHLQGMLYLSIARIEAGEAKLVIYVGAVWMYSCMIYYYCYRLNKDWAHLLRKDPSITWKDERTNIRMRTIMVENVPRKWAHESDTFRQGFSQLFGSENITYAELAPKMAKTQKLKRDRKKLINRWKDARSLLEEKGIRPMVHPNWMSFFQRRKKVDAISYYEKRIEEIDQNIDDSLALESNRSNSKVGFVTFSNYNTAAQAATAIYDTRSNKFRAIRAPDAKDINWHNLHMSEEEVLIRGIIAWIILLVVFAFWSTPILAIAALSTLDSLFTSNWVGDFFSGGNTAEVIASRIVPIVLLVLFLSFVPYLYALILYRRGYKVKSDEEVSILWAYFITLYVYIFLIPVFAGPLDRDIWTDLVKDTSNTIERFANSLTANAGFIYQWLLVQASVEYAWFRCVRFHQFLLGVLPKWAKARAERAKRAAFNPVSFFYPKQYGRELLAFALGLSYCIMAPLVTPVAVVYLSFAYVTAKNNFIFLYRAPIEGLALIVNVIDIVLFITFIWQVLMVGIFALKEYPGGYTIILFAAFTVVFRFLLRHTFGAASQHVPLRYLPNWRTNQSKGDETPIVAKYYVNPATHPRTSMEEEENQRRVEQTQPYLTGIIRGEEPPTFPL